MGNAMTIGTRYYDVMQEFLQGMRAGLMGYLQCGKAIEAIKNEKLWRLDGAHVKSFGQFCKQVLHISPAHAHRMSQICREVGHLLIRPELQQDITKITLLLPYFDGQDDEKKEALLLEARDISIEALRNNLLEKQGRGELCTDICDHPADMLEEWTKCRKCGKFLR